jgi:hypothetical protein
MPVLSEYYLGLGEAKKASVKSIWNSILTVLGGVRVRRLPTESESKEELRENNTQSDCNIRAF